MTSTTTCSGRAVESTIIAFMPPVSAISVGSGALSRAARARLIICAVSVPPVNTTPVMRGSEVSTLPTVGPSPGSSCTTSRGIPASYSSSITRWATIEVCSAGFARTVLPATAAATICPQKMATGKFQGLMAAKTPLPPIIKRLDSPVGPGSSMGSPNDSSARMA